MIPRVTLWVQLLNQNRGQFMKIEDKLNLSEDRGQIAKIEDSPLINQAVGQPTSNLSHTLE